MFKFCAPTSARAAASFDGGWVLYERRPTETASPLWVQFKLMLPETTRKRAGLKRTYWLTWNPIAARLARSGDAYALLTQQPDLHAQVVLELKLSYPRSWLTDNAGMTEAEINAEIGRLAAQRQLQVAKQEARRRNGESL